MTSSPVSAGRTRRRCKLCDRKLPNGVPAVRVENNDGSASGSWGQLRYWLCRYCADQVDQAIAQIKVAS